MESTTTPVVYRRLVVDLQNGRASLEESKHFSTSQPTVFAEGAITAYY